MSIETALRRYLARFVEDTHRLKREAETHYSWAHEKLLDARAKNDAAAHTAGRSSQRAADFVPTRGIDFQCPRCWIFDEKASGLTPLPEDVFRCETCGQRYEIS